MSMIPTKKEVINGLHASNTALKAENLLLIELVEKGYREAARANCHARYLGDIQICIDEFWLNSKIKRELDEMEGGK